ncbi:alpha/beta fold hydrolase [Microlunatus soli]|uniref:Pimeloyl-ACP methyl ester carboxylesterase n=1 Tax=Microlunatus soli TaxID=630515 RepID=A0A1H1UAN2_9ACTN|nr:alpha/beta hydrolase [Microlunatus soli]SDS69480.1 Pimeloyl-ACP methyl ester carboxylesterase [Microlunatus soli]
MDARTRLVPPGSAETFVASGGGVFRVLRGESEGSGTPILLVHGGGSDNAAISWYRLIAEFARGRRVIAPDLPGFGYTAHVRLARSAAGMADQLAELLDRLQIDRVIVCGVSMGGEVVLQFALRHPERVEAVVAIAAGGLIEQWRGPLAHRLAWIGTLIPDPALIPMTALANRFVRSMINTMVRDPSTLPDVVVEEFAAEARRPRSGYAYSLYTRASIDRRRMTNNLLPRIHEIAAPTLLFHGADDPLVDPSGSKTAARLMPHARLDLVPDCGHWAQLEHHDRFLRTVTEFLVAPP